MNNYKSVSFWDINKLWELRKEICLNSLYVADYENSFDIPAKITCDFFYGYMDYLQELERENNENLPIEQFFNKYDTIDNLWNWFNCFDICPFSY